MKFKLILLVAVLALFISVFLGCGRVECEHTVDKWTFYDGESCEGATYIGICTKCGDSTERTGTDTDHDWSTTTVRPTCESGGYDIKVCANCEKSEVFNETLPLGHAMSSTVTEASCDKAGSVISRCNLCDYEETVAGAPALGHDYSDDFSVDADTHWRACKRCGNKKDIGYHVFNGDTCLICREVINEYNVTIWVSELAGVTDIVRAQIDAFEEANPGIIINAKVIGVSPADAVSRIFLESEDAPDIFCFTQDQLARLVSYGALMPLDESAAAMVLENNAQGAISAATHNSRLYAYPLSEDNGCYLYYDRSIISDSSAADLQSLISDCEENGVSLRVDLSNGWYIASFFFATGCISEWNADLTAVKDNFNSEEGLIAMKAMKELLQSSCYNQDNNVFRDTGAIISGTWNIDEAKQYFGNNLGVAPLPYFSMDGQSYHMGSYLGAKLLGITPQSNERKAAVLSKLTEYLTGSECQTELYEAYEWIPTNKAVQEKVSSEKPHYAALIEQNEYAVPQGNIHGLWWGVIYELGYDVKNAENDDDLRTALQKYEDAIKAFLLEENGDVQWSVIGDIGGTLWDHDFILTKVSDNVWISESIEMDEGAEFKIRQDLSWSNDFSMNSTMIEVVVAGTYQVQLVLNDDGTVNVSLIPT